VRCCATWQVVEALSNILQSHIGWSLVVVAATKTQRRNQRGNKKGGVAALDVARGTY
jgi:hypothetical protein